MAELRSAVLAGVTIGVGSQILIFGNGVTVLIQYPFKCDNKGSERWGHGEEVATGVLSFDYLNSKVESAVFKVGGLLVLDFGSVGSLVIVPDSNGLESYVLTTKLGVSPVSVI
ncbi:hypothetical protein [Pseudomonas rubra]|uniref:Uncharacterized protein n=1 Tax=Pseudomonas rubra TaxID=2942627 RepID=A0ABT5PEA3_9PSED|nr:hypothetical protein [Pseudomonas rubra]MDD1016650.1 hypothetical protein [Pseudomonas rubra]MDD1039447.1 hypothetical protein [Pseudomonas rubra]MDD1154892.1 hypothetical protein [Pseudomonas rubra]